jgi:hypothetical protein
MLAPVWAAVRRRVAHLDLRQDLREEHTALGGSIHTSPGGSLLGSSRIPKHFAVRSKLPSGTLAELGECGEYLGWLATHLSNVLVNFLPDIGEDYIALLRHSPLVGVKVFPNSDGESPVLTSGAFYRGEHRTVALVIVAPHADNGAVAHGATIRVPVTLGGGFAWYDPRTPDSSVYGESSASVGYRVSLLGYPSTEDTPECPWPDAWVHALLMQAESAVERAL